MCRPAPLPTFTPAGAALGGAVAGAATGAAINAATAPFYGPGYVAPTYVSAPTVVVPSYDYEEPGTYEAPNNGLAPPPGCVNC